MTGTAPTCWSIRRPKNESMSTWTQGTDRRCPTRSTASTRTTTTSSESRHRRRLLYVATTGVLSFAVFAVLVDGPDHTRFCTADGLIAPGGPWARNADHDCRFEDPDGNPYIDE